MGKSLRFKELTCSELYCRSVAQFDSTWISQGTWSYFGMQMGQSRWYMEPWVYCNSPQLLKLLEGLWVAGRWNYPVSSSKWKRWKKNDSAIENDSESLWKNAKGTNPNWWAWENLFRSPWLFDRVLELTCKGRLRDDPHIFPGDSSFRRIFEKLKSKSDTRTWRISQFPWRRRCRRRYRIFLS